jgi:cell shape-determining protein MreC
MNNFSNYDPKIVSIYEILGSYFTDILFNHIFLMSKNSKNVIDEYVKNVQNYVSGIKNNIEYYNKTIIELHQYFLKIAGRKYMDLKLADFVSRIVSISSPPDQYAKLTYADKEDIFSNIISELVANICAFATSHEMLQFIVINHTKNPKTTIRAIQDNAVNFLIEKRALLFNAFVKNVGDVKEHTAVAYTEDLKKSLKKAIKEKNEAIEELENSFDEIESLKKKNSNYKKELELAKSTETKLRKLIDLLNVKNEKGVMAAANLVRQPQQELLAEGRALIPYDDVPKKESIAESKNKPLNNFFAKPLKIDMNSNNFAIAKPVVHEDRIAETDDFNIFSDNIISTPSTGEISDNYLNLLR